MKSILWGRIVIYGVVLEIVLIGLIVLTRKWYELSTVEMFIPMCLFMLYGGFMVGRKAQSQKVLQGALVGLVASLVYVIITLGMVIKGDLPIDSVYIGGHLLKIFFGGLGGFIALKQR